MEMGSTLQTWEVALYGLLTVTGMGILQFFITQYFKKSEKMKDDKMQELFDMIKELNSNVKILTEKLSDHAIQIALCKEKAVMMESRLNEIERRINKN